MYKKLLTRLIKYMIIILKHNMDLVFQSSNLLDFSSNFLFESMKNIKSLFCFFISKKSYINRFN